MKKILLVTPWVGEFGWELFCWQAHIRFLSKQYDKTIVMSRPNNKFLYDDFAEFIPFDSPTENADSWRGKKVTPIELKKALDDRKYTHVYHPTNIGFLPVKGNDFNTSPKFQYQQKFVKLESNTLDKKYDIILHARNKKVGSIRNWNKENWIELVYKLKEKGFSLCTIGNNESFKLEGVDNYRNRPIEDTVSLMNRAKLIVGQSSGALHLASLAGLPHLVWSDKTNFLRYTKYWNPFNTKCIFYDKEAWNPKVISIYNNIIKNI